MVTLRSLGSTHILVSPLGLGTVKLGRNQGVKYPEAFSLPTDAAIVELLATAKDLGINVLDTAPAYGESEMRLGNLLGRQRSDWAIFTKVGEEFEQGQSQFNFTPEHCRFSIERSLKRLKTDYLDGVMVHSDGQDVYNIQHFGILDCLRDIKQQGLIKSFGMSTKTIEGGLMAVEQSDFVMVTYNPIETQERAVIQHAHQHQKGVFIKKALMSGHLQKVDSANPAQDSLQFVLQEPGVSSIIVGTLSPQHLMQNCQSVLSVVPGECVQ